MDEFYEKLSTDSTYGINILNTDCPYLDIPFHFHPETEIMYMEKGSGTRFVGDHSEPFSQGDICLIGPNLPHVWRSDPVYRENIPGLTAHVQVVHFHDAVLKGPLAGLPEMKAGGRNRTRRRKNVAVFWLSYLHPLRGLRAKGESTGGGADHDGIAGFVNRLNPLIGRPGD